jgi:chromate transporter
LKDKRFFREIFELYAVFFRIGLVTIGGGYVMLPIILAETVDRKKWVSEDEVINYYALSQSIPGIIAINTASLVGYHRRKLPGAIAAALGVMTPSIIIIMLVAAFCVGFWREPIVQKAFTGIRAAVAALILSAVVRMWKKAVKNWLGLTLAIIAFGAVIFFSVSPIIMILIGAAIGLLYGFYPRRNKEEKETAS